MRYEQGSFITVPSKEILRGVHPTAQVLYMWLCSYANETGNCYPSRGRLAKDCGCSDSMIDNMLVLLEEKGLVKRQGRKEMDKQLTNLYTVLIVPPLPHSATPPPTVLDTPSHDVGTNSIHRTKSNEPAADAAEEIREVPFFEEDGREKRALKTNSAMRAVFDLFTDNPARHIWKKRELERDSAQVLFDVYGIDELRLRYRVAQQHRGEEYCPVIFTPATFLDKMPNMEIFLKRLQS